MNILGWNSPIGLAAFLAGVGVIVALVGWGLRQYAEASERFMSLPNKRR